MTRKIQYPASATINPRDLRNTSLKDARDLQFLENLKDTTFTKTYLEAKTATGLDRYYKPINATTDGAYIYLLVSNEDNDRTKNGIVVLDAYSLEVIASAMNLFTSDKVSDIIVDENYVYVLGYTSAINYTLYKINKNTLTIYTSHTETANITKTTRLIHNGMYIWAVSYTTTARRIDLIDRENMTVDATYSDATITENINALTADSSYVYAAIDTSPGKILKIDRNTLAIVATWTGAANENKTRDIIYDGINLYTAVSGPFALAIKINPNDMTTIAKYTDGNYSPNHDMSIISQKNHIKLVYRSELTAIRARMVLKSSMTSPSATTITIADKFIGACESGIWQHYVYMTASNVYGVRKELTDTNNTTTIYGDILSKISAYLGTAVQSIPNITVTTITLNTKLFDTEKEFDQVTNYTATIRKTGYYNISAQVYLLAATVGSVLQLYVLKNGTTIMLDEKNVSVAGNLMAGTTKQVYLTANDQIKIAVWHNNGVAKNIDFGAEKTFLSIVRIPDNI